MIATGIVRRIDDLGRVVIPKAMRQKFHISEGDPLEIFYDDAGVTFRKYVTDADVKQPIINGFQELAGLIQHPIILFGPDRAIFAVLGFNKAGLEIGAADVMGTKVESMPFSECTSGAAFIGESELRVLLGVSPEQLGALAYTKIPLALAYESDDYIGAIVCGCGGMPELSPEEEKLFRITVGLLRKGQVC